MACYGVIFETSSAKWLSPGGKWISVEYNAEKIAPSDILSKVKEYNIERLLKKGTLQFHLKSM